MEPFADRTGVSLGRDLLASSGRMAELVGASRGRLRRDHFARVRQFPDPTRSYSSLEIADE